MSQKDNFSERASRGQAYNLAVLTTSKKGLFDMESVVKEYIMHMRRAAFFQAVDSLDELAKVVEMEDFLELSKKLDSYVSKT